MPRCMYVKHLKREHRTSCGERRVRKQETSFILLMCSWIQYLNSWYKLTQTKKQYNNLPHVKQAETAKDSSPSAKKGPSCNVNSYYPHLSELYTHLTDCEGKYEGPSKLNHPNTIEILSGLKYIWKTRIMFLGFKFNEWLTLAFL